MVSFSKTRIAPTPSGFLHAGNALNFLLTSVLAQQAGASLLLRIDDLDRERYRRDYVTDIFETLHFLKISWQEGPHNIIDFEQNWSQPHRMHLYHEALKKLRDQHHVFACTCSRTQMQACTCAAKNISLDAPNVSWRLLTDETLLSIRTMDGHVIKASLPTTMKNFVVRRRDGVPAYQLASVIDDLHFGIDFIVRGEDLWSSTLAQQYLAKCLGKKMFSSICFYHHPLLTNNKGEKLSKSAGAFSVKYWREHEQTLENYFKYLSVLLHLSTPAHTASDLLQVFMV